MPEKEWKSDSGGNHDPRDVVKTFWYTGSTFRDRITTEGVERFITAPTRDRGPEDNTIAVERGIAEKSFIELEAVVGELGQNAITAEAATDQAIGERQEEVLELDLDRGFTARFRGRASEELLTSVSFPRQHRAVHIFPASPISEERDEPIQWVNSDEKGLRIATDDPFPKHPGIEAYRRVADRINSVVEVTESVYIDIPYKRK